MLVFLFVIYVSLYLTFAQLRNLILIVYTSTYFVFLNFTHSDSKGGNPLLLFPISGKTAHTTTFVIPVVEHWLEQEIA